MDVWSKFIDKLAGFDCREYATAGLMHTKIDEVRVYQEYSARLYKKVEKASIVFRMGGKKFAAFSCLHASAS